MFGAAIRPTGKPSPLLRRRLVGAVEAGKRCREPLYLVSGGSSDAGGIEADVMRQTLLEHGVAADAILRDPLSRDTLEQARRAAAILDRLGQVGRVLVCTSRWHQPRCRVLLRMLGVHGEAITTPADFSEGGWRRWTYYALREVAATLWDAGLLAVLVSLGRGRLTGPGGGSG